MKMVLKSNDKKPFSEIATILDGQHRIEGLKDYAGDNFDINVSIFVGIPISTMANIFATVNLAQTKVNKSLVYDLLDYEKSRSPQKTAHHIAVALDEKDDSPLSQRIKRLGTATTGREKEQLTQATFVENLDNKDEVIAKIIKEYFQAVAETWPKSWNDFDTPGNMLPKTNGFIALMSVLRPVYLSIVGQDIGKEVSSNDFKKLFANVTSLKDGEINTTIFKPGSSGSGLMKRMLLKDIFGVDKESDIDFNQLSLV
ncbi:MAG: DGQHR domain-containing protein [Alphaproteobacteria bacterium]|nr:DGQHR domain-containing protein [Alphaproteobacteria bacterium]